MRRRPFLATLGASAVGAVAGCLGALGDNDTDPGTDELLEGRSQWGYDAQNSRHAAGITGPTNEPTLQRAYENVSYIPLTHNDAFYTSRWSVGFDGGSRWDDPSPTSASLYPALYDDTVVNAGGDPGVFWAVSIDDGTERWQTQLSGWPSPGQNPQYGRIVVLADQAYFPTFHGIGCVDLAAREEAWHADLEAELPFAVRGEWLTPAVTSANLFAVNHLYDPDRDYEDHPPQLHALDRETGEIDWTVDLNLGEPRFKYAPPLVGNKYVFVSAEVHENPQSDGGKRTHVVAVDPDARDVVWRKAFAGHSGPAPAVANGQLYVAHRNVAEQEPPLLSAMNTADGAVEWTVETASLGFIPTVTDELIYAVNDTLVRAFDPDTGEGRWSVELRDHPELPQPTEVAWHSQSPPVVHDGRIFRYIGDGWLAGLW